MSFFAGASRFFLPHKHQPTRAELEQQAQEEIQARIDLGRPGAEEGVRRGPRPDWTLPRPPVTRTLDVVAVNLDAIQPPVPVPSELQRERTAITN